MYMTHSQLQCKTYKPNIKSAYTQPLAFIFIHFETIVNDPNTVWYFHRAHTYLCIYIFDSLGLSIYHNLSVCMISFLFHSLFHWLPVCKTTYGVFQLPSDSLCRILFPSLFYTQYIIYVCWLCVYAFFTLRFAWLCTAAGAQAFALITFSWIRSSELKRSIFYLFSS